MIFCFMQITSYIENLTSLSCGDLRRPSLDVGCIGSKFYKKGNHRLFGGPFFLCHGCRSTMRNLRRLFHDVYDLGGLLLKFSTIIRNRFNRTMCFTQILRRLENLNPGRRSGAQPNNNENKVGIVTDKQVYVTNGGISTGRASILNCTW
jgi:hypothetical protein